MATALAKLGLAILAILFNYFNIFIKKTIKKTIE